MSNVPKNLLIHLKESKVHLENAREVIHRLLKSKSPEQICKYGENNLYYYRTILNNIHKGIEKIVNPTCLD